MAKAKPPIVLTTRMIATDATVTSVELNSCCATGSTSDSSNQLSSENPDRVRYWLYDRSDVNAMK